MPMIGLCVCESAELWRRRLGEMTEAADRGVHVVPLEADWCGAVCAVPKALAVAVRAVADATVA